MNPDLPAMLDDALSRGFDALVLTNAMKPMAKCKPALLAAQRALWRPADDPRLDRPLRAARCTRRSAAGAAGSRRSTGSDGSRATGFRSHVASRRLSGESEAEIRGGFARLFAGLGIAIDADDPVALMVFPEMDAAADVPEITEACWGILGKSPESVMCASARMVVKRKGAARPAVLACTLLPYDERFELGPTLAAASGAVPLNHPHCAKFCVLGGGACSRS